MTTRAGARPPMLRTTSRARMPPTMSRAQTPPMASRAQMPPTTSQAQMPRRTASPTQRATRCPRSTPAKEADLAMPASLLIHHAQQALLLVVAVSLPALAVAALVGLTVAAFQAASQIQDATLAHLP